ncbi:hypothetical protein HW40_12425 [Mannheimia haemolytica]|nr:hypothetical protein [Mannheimia haemolytica]KIX27404.1 hypothetical protein HW40_12425 [Mannheimia haemolytica]HDL5009587.1 hypothetical protein [Mannheimia haemolytica]
MKLKALSTLIASSMLYSQSFAVPPEKTAEEPQPFFNKTESGYDLVFNDQNYRLIETELNGEKIQFRAFERIVYVNNPIEPDYQTINLYVPEAYYNNGEINGYQADTAPIFLPNSVGGYMPAKAASYDKKRRDGSPGTILVALSKGYVVASVGARGRTLQKEGKYTGKAPSAIIDSESAAHKACRFESDHWHHSLCKI